MPRKTVQKIGILLEQKADAAAFLKKHTDRAFRLEDLYHWREPEEIQAIQAAIELLGFETRLLGNPQGLLQGLPHALAEIDFVLNLSVGFISPSRLAAGASLLESLGIPYSGAGPYSKMLSQHKPLLKSWLQAAGFPTPAWICIYPGDPIPDALPPFPLIAKPAYEGSSVGIGPKAKLYNRAELADRVAEIHGRLNMPVLIEQFIVGREIKVAYVGNETPVLRAILEDTHKDGTALGDAFLYFQAKKTGHYLKKRISTVDQDMEPIIRDCDTIYQRMLPMDYGSFDLRIDDTGQHYFLECQSDATLHPERTLAQCAALAGWSYPQLIESILKAAFNRYDLH